MLVPNSLISIKINQRAVMLTRDVFQRQKRMSWALLDGVRVGQTHRRGVNSDNKFKFYGYQRNYGSHRTL